MSYLVRLETILLNEIRLFGLGEGGVGKHRAIIKAYAICLDNQCEQLS